MALTLMRAGQAFLEEFHRRRMVSGVVFVAGESFRWLLSQEMKPQDRERSLTGLCWEDVIEVWQEEGSVVGQRWVFAKWVGGQRVKVVLSLGKPSGPVICWQMNELREKVTATEWKVAG